MCNFTPVSILRNSVLPLLLTLILYGCKKDDVDQQIQTNTWESTDDNPWDVYTTVASNNKIAYFVGNSIYTQSEAGFSKIADFPKQDLLDKFAVVAENGNLITGGGYRNGDAYVSWSFYVYDNKGNLLATQSIPDVYFGAAYPGKIYTANNRILTSVNERQLGDVGTIYQKYIYVWDQEFKILFKSKIDNAIELSRVFTINGKAYLVFSNGKVSELKSDKIEEAPGVNLNLENPAQNGIPAMAAINSRLVYGWAPRVNGSDYVPSDKMTVTDLNTSATLDNVPAVCDPQLYYLNDVLYLVGGYTGKVDQKVYNEKLYSIRLPAQL